MNYFHESVWLEFFLPMAVLCYVFCAMCHFRETEDLSTFDCFLWATIGVPSALVIYIVCLPFAVLYGFPVFLKAVVAKYIERRQKNGKS